MPFEIYFWTSRNNKSLTFFGKSLITIQMLKTSSYLFKKNFCVDLFFPANACQNLEVFYHYGLKLHN